MPARFIRFIFNRLLLENAIVRACAISTLGDFAFNCPDLRASIRTNLRRCLHDEDDEVRDRTTILLSILDQPEYDDSKRYFLAQEPMPMSFTALDRSVRAYMAHPMYDATVASAGVLTFASLPIVEEAYVPPANLPKGTKKANKDDAPSSSSNDEAVVAAAVDPAAAVYAVPQFVKYGRAFRSCAEVPLTEAVMEYVISCVKHVFADYVVLQFKIMNTLDNQQLRDVRINVEVDGQEMYTVETVIPAAVARYGEHANCFVSLKRNEEAGYDSVTLPCEMTFKMVEVDATTGEPESDDPTDEEYALEAVEVNTNDYMAKVNVPDFRRNWDAAGTDGEVLEKFALQFKKKEDAVNAVIDFLGMQAVDNTQTVAPDEPGAKKPHTIHLSGVFVGNIPVLVRAQVQMDDANGAILKIAVRSQIKEVSQIVAECIH